MQADVTWKRRKVHAIPDLVETLRSAASDTAIKERFSVQFRAEAFNLLNHPNFTQPQNSITAATTLAGNSGPNTESRALMRTAWADCSCWLRSVCTA